MLQAKDFLDVLDLFVLHDLVVFCITHVQQLSSQWEDAVVVASDDTQTSDGQRFGGVSFGKDECTEFCLLRTGVVGIGQLGQAFQADTNCFNVREVSIY